MQEQGREWMNGLRLVLSDKKYSWMLASLTAAFIIVFIFEWNLILFGNMYVRQDLWTPENIFFLGAISALSALAVTLGIYSLKARIPYYQGKYGYLAMVPAIFASACPTCAPLILSFSSTAFAVGMSLAKYNVALRVASIIALLATVAYTSEKITSCGTQRAKQ